MQLLSCNPVNVIYSPTLYTVLSANTQLHHRAHCSLPDAKKTKITTFTIQTVNFGNGMHFSSKCLYFSVHFTSINTHIIWTLLPTPALIHYFQAITILDSVQQLPAPHVSSYHGECFCTCTYTAWVCYNKSDAALGCQVVQWPTLCQVTDCRCNSARMQIYTCTHANSKQCTY